MSNAEVNSGLEAAGITEYQRRQSYGWQKFGRLSGAGAPARVAEFANSIAKALIHAGRASEIEFVFNSSDLNATHAVEDTLAKLSKRMSALLKSPTLQKPQPSGMTGIIAGIPSKPSKPSSQTKPSVNIPAPPSDPRDG